MNAVVINRPFVESLRAAGAVATAGAPSLIAVFPGFGAAIAAHFVAYLALHVLPPLLGVAS